MSQFIDRLMFLKKYTGTFSHSHGVSTNESRTWEDRYRDRWNCEKIVRSTHGVNCTGSCSWRIYVKSGIVTWEMQQTDYPQTPCDYPNHEPRGCARGASYSWYLYSSNRIRHPRIRRELIELWRKARETHSPVEAWSWIQGEGSAETRKLEYVRSRGHGNFVRVSWEEANEIIAAANIYTIKKYGPDRIAGFSPIPAMSQVSYASGIRYLSLLGGVALSFYDWYCDLPPASPQVIGEQTDVPESLDWYNATYLLIWGSNPPMTRTPDCHFYSEVRYKGAKSVVITPDYADAAKFADLWLHPTAGTDAALAISFTHIVMREFYLERLSPYFADYARRFTDLPFLVLLEEGEAGFKCGRLLRAAEMEDSCFYEGDADWKPLIWDEDRQGPAIPRGTAGERWAENGKWNLEPFDAVTGEKITPALSLGERDAIGRISQTKHCVEVSFPYFGDVGHFGRAKAESVQKRSIPIRNVRLRGGREAKVATIFDLMAGSVGISVASGQFPDYQDASVPGTPAWQEKATGVPAEKCLAVARGFARNAEATKGKSMVILGAGLNHWYNMDMAYRAILNLTILCGCVGQNGGGWAHYVGQEKLRPAAGLAPIAFAADWGGGARRMNATSFFYNHTDQWRYERITPQDLLSPLASLESVPKTMIDCNVMAERLGWLPSAPQLSANPLNVARSAKESGKDAAQYVRDELVSGRLKMANQRPDSPENWPRNLFVWRSNLLGSSGKGLEYFFQHLIGAGENHFNTESDQRPDFVEWAEKAPQGKLDLLVTLDFRMSTTALFSDIVLPAATWYEKTDLSTSDMHSFIHPFQPAIPPAWEAREDWTIFRGITKKFQELAKGHLGEEADIVLSPLGKDTPAELSQPYGARDWLKEKDAPAVPGKTMPSISLVLRDYEKIYDRFITLGPVLAEKGNGINGVHWPASEELAALRKERPSVSCAYPEGSSLFSDVDVAETILALAPETNGNVAVKSWQAEFKKTGLDLTKYADGRSEEQIRLHDIVVQPRQVMNAATSSGVCSAKQAYASSWLNIHENMPFRTLTGRLQFYQDHPWMRDFGENFATYRPPLNTKSTPQGLSEKLDNGRPALALNLLTPHQKWGIHSTYAENLFMLTLFRGGPCAWISEKDAQKADIKDNDWMEAFNLNGSFIVRAVISQRIPQGTCFFYHSQERLSSVPGSEMTGRRGGVDNSVSRIILKPTHMIGGYAQLSYGFNYYGPVGANRDEFVFLRKMKHVDWLEDGDES